MNAVAGTGSAGIASKGQGADGKLPAGPCSAKPGYITDWDSTGALCASALFQVIGGSTNGYIGINKVNPSTQLEVNGEISTSKWYDINAQPFVRAGGSDNTSAFFGFGAGSQQYHRGIEHLRRVPCWFQ